LIGQGRALRDASRQRDRVEPSKCEVLVRSIPRPQERRRGREEVEREVCRPASLTTFLEFPVKAEAQRLSDAN